MTAKRIFILNGHPAETSLSRSFAETYAQAARAAGHDVRITHLNDLTFDSDYGFAGYGQSKPLEPDLIAFQKDIEWSQHVVLMTPMWWGGLPAKLKGLIDRSFMPGWAFDTRVLKMGMPTPLLKGRTARAIITSDTPTFLFRLMYGKALIRQLKGQIFHFVGMKPAKITHLSPASHADANRVAPWMEKIKELGRRGG